MWSAAVQILHIWIGTSIFSQSHKANIVTLAKNGFLCVPSILCRKTVYLFYISSLFPQTKIKKTAKTLFECIFKIIQTFASVSKHSAMKIDIFSLETQMRNKVWCAIFPAHRFFCVLGCWELPAMTLCYKIAFTVESQDFNANCFCDKVK